MYGAVLFHLLTFSALCGPAAAGEADSSFLPGRIFSWPDAAPSSRFKRAAGQELPPSTTSGSALLSFGRFPSPREIPSVATRNGALPRRVAETLRLKEVSETSAGTTTVVFEQYLFGFRVWGAVFTASLKRANERALAFCTWRLALPLALPPRLSGSFPPARSALRIPSGFRVKSVSEPVLLPIDGVLTLARAIRVRGARGWNSGVLFEEVGSGRLLCRQISWRKLSGVRTGRRNLV